MEKEKEQASSTPKFWESTEGKTKSNKIEVPSISLPKGGGAIRGIDEKFSVNAANGTSSFSIPLPASEARGFSPTLAVQYSSGAGNGIFGLGWSLEISSIKRKTDKKLPEYLDHLESDVFVLSGAEDLVPEFRKDVQGLFVITNGDYELNENGRTWNGIDYKVKGYLPRVESGFAKIERWTAKDSRRTHWRTISGTNVTTLFGYSDEAKICDPENETNVFEWLIEFSFDDRGNCIYYQHRREDDKALPADLHNRNRKKTKLLYTNSYPKRILYGIKKPYTGNGSMFSKNTADYFFETVFDYGDHNGTPPHAPKASQLWNFRTDAFSEYKSGFEIRTTRLCKRILHYHHFQELPGGTALVNSIGFTYSDNGMDGFSFLANVTSSGHIKKPDNSYSSKSLPELIFRYQQHDWNTEIRTVSKDDLVHAPAGIGGGYTFTDLFSEGLPGILTEQANGWYYKSNLGSGKFTPAALVSPKPSFQGLNQQLQLMELEGNGVKQLVHLESEPKGFFELSPDAEWQSLKLFERTPSVQQNAHTRMIDLDGNGVAEMLVSEHDGFSWYGSEGKKGYSSLKKRNRSFNEEDGAVVDFATQQDEIFLADMSGDGLTDLVRIRNGNICYWPNLGYGRFGRKVAMDNAPLFDHPDHFNPQYIKLADIDGSGTTDIIYLGKNKCSIYLNQQGNKYSAARAIEPFLPIDSSVEVDVTDLLGNGVSCITWNDPKEEQAPLKYIDLMNGKKPHVLTGFSNNMGKEVEMEYRPSTSYYLEDKAAGRPWITKLHFPVQCVNRTTTKDLITGVQFSSHYRYRHGYFDHEENEFRGFGMVEQTDTEKFEHWIKSGASNIVERDLHQDPVLTRTWFHTGAFEELDSIAGQYEKEYWYNAINKHGVSVSSDALLPGARVIADPALGQSAVSAMSNSEWRDALRACKSLELRSEVFGKDAPLIGATPAQILKQLTPYTVSDNNCLIELLQPQGKNRHAVFLVKDSETISFTYDRDREDPRVSHVLNTEFDRFGNILEAVTVNYSRKRTDATLPASTRRSQMKTSVVLAKNGFTNHISDLDSHHSPVSSEQMLFELKNVPKAGAIYTLQDLSGVFNNAAAAEYHEYDKEPVSGVQKRLVEHTRSVYLDTNLVTPLTLHELKCPAIAHENFQLAFTPVLLNDLFGGKVNTSLMGDAGYQHNGGDSNWWIRSGTSQYLQAGQVPAAARNRFLHPVTVTSAIGSVTKLKYYKDYFLFIEETEDEAGNKQTVELFNFRTLSAQRMKDSNNNLSETITDELGIVKASAVMGKGTEGDNLSGLTEYETASERTFIDNFFHTSKRFKYTPADPDASGLIRNAGSRFVYDIDAFRLRGLPAVIATITREEHFTMNAASLIQLTFEYSNGLGEIVMKKTQAEPGIGLQANGTGIAQRVDTTPHLRWIGTGRTILNNKGNAVKKYESYYSTSQLFEIEKELVETGVSPITYFDPLGRALRTDMPDGTMTKEVFDPWKDHLYDQSDTVAESKWYNDRVGRLIDAELLAADKDPVREEEAAVRSYAHRQTPVTYCFDVSGRKILSIEHNRNTGTGADEYYHTSVLIDIEGNVREIIDARDNKILRAGYDLLGNRLFVHYNDSGKRWTLNTVTGLPFRTWDERDHEHQYKYDILERPIEIKVIGGDGTVALDHIVSKTIYGEGELNAEQRNLRGHAFRQYDTGGMVETTDYDFKGSPVSVKRRLARKYKEVVNWKPANLVNDLETEEYIFIKEFDALGRLRKETDPASNVFEPFYNESGQLLKERITHQTPATVSDYIQKISYNEKGLRTKTVYGNGVIASNSYDRFTFRLISKKVVRSDNSVLQDLAYTFDAAGNITHIKDNAVATEFYRNARIEPANEYTYDALYRLVQATGRENSSTLLHSREDNWDDVSYKHEMNPGDPIRSRPYQQNYSYDKVGNITEMKHTTNDSSANWWTRNYEYEANTNRLIKTIVGQGSNSQEYRYEYHSSHGFITKMPHVEQLNWNFKEELASTTRQRRTDGGTPEITYYQYDGQGARLRKITENQAAPSQTPTKKDERIYLGGYEVYNQYSGANAGLKRITVSLVDQGQRFVMIETRNNINDGTDQHMVRYQMQNHLGSGVLELGGNLQAEVISYEEYHPYGTTAYQIRNKTIKAAGKRYRFTGMERDDETGLEYHSARYYMPWLGRWLNPDPIGLKGGLNVYEYGSSCPLTFEDKQGLAPKSPERKIGEQQQRRFRAANNMKGATVQAGHLATVRHAILSGITKFIWDMAPMMQLHSRRGMGLDVEVTNENGTKTTNTRHNAQEKIVDQNMERSMKVQGKATPQAQMENAFQTEWQAKNVPLDQPNVEAVRNSGPAKPSAVDADLNAKGEVIDGPNTRAAKERLAAKKAAATTEGKGGATQKSNAESLTGGKKAADVSGKQSPKSNTKVNSVTAPKISPGVRSAAKATGTGLGVVMFGMSVKDYAEKMEKGDYEGARDTAAVTALSLTPAAPLVVAAAVIGKYENDPTIEARAFAAGDVVMEKTGSAVAGGVVSAGAAVGISVYETGKDLYNGVVDFVDWGVQKTIG